MNSLDSKKTRLYKQAMSNKLPIEYMSHRSSLTKQIYKLNVSGTPVAQVIEQLMRQYVIGAEHLVFFMFKNLAHVELDQVNPIMIQNNISPFLDMNDFDSRYQRWLHYFKNLFFRTSLTWSNIINTQNILINDRDTLAPRYPLEPPALYRITYSKTTLTYRAMLDSAREWDVLSTIDLINNCQTTQYVPFMQAFSSDGSSIYKVFLSEDSMNNQSGDKFLSFTQDKFKPDHIYFYVWNGRNVNNKNSYSESVYNVKEAILEVTVDRPSDPVTSSRESEDLTSSLEKYKDQLTFTMPFFRFMAAESKNINVDITYYNVNMNMDIFYFMVDQDPIVSKYLSLFESTNLRYNTSSGEENNKKRLTMLYHNIIPNNYNITVKFTQKYLENVISLIASVNGISDGAEVTEIATILNYLIERYQDKKDTYVNFIRENIGQVPEAEQLKYDLPISRIKALMSEYPEVFGANEESKNGYSRSCQKKYQPIIIADDEVDSWEKLTINGQPRQVAQYPPPKEGVQKLFNYVCPNDKFPWPSLKPNKEESLSFDLNQVDYRRVPCCCQTNRYDQYLTEGTGPFALFYEKGKKVGKENILKSFGIIKEGSLGRLPPLISTHLEMSVNVTEYISNRSRRSEVDDEPNELECGEEADDDSGGSVNYMHYSVGQYLDSFIRCILYALNLPDDPQMVRQRLASLFPALYAQENVLGDVAFLRDKLLNGYVDPLLFYRGLEEIFNVSIYIFNAEDYSLATPYHRINHIRPYRKVSCILIWYYPSMLVSELIVRLDSLTSEGKKNKMKVFSMDMSRHVYQSVDGCYQLDVSNKNGGKQEINYNPFSHINWDEVYLWMLNSGWKFLNQTIDSNGKCRGFTAASMSSSERVVFFIPPGQPINLDDTSFRVFPVDPATAIRFAGQEPFSRAPGLGYWFSMLGIDEFLFIPTTSTREDLPVALNLAPISNLAGPGRTIEKEVDVVLESHKLSSLLPELIWWVYLVDLKKNKVQFSSWDLWWNKFVQVDQEAAVDFFVDVQKLVTVNDASVAINYLTQYYPKIFREGQIRLPDRLYRQLKQTMLFWVRDREGMTLNPTVTIRKKFSTENDFNQINCKTFLSLENMKTWINNAANSTGRYRFISQLDQINGREPAIFRFAHGKEQTIYMIQKEIKLSMAVWNSFQFRKSKINKSHVQVSSSEMSGFDELPYLIYVMVGGTLFLREKVNWPSEEPDHFGEILSNGDDIYSLLFF